jgi:vitellogenic carboxypeptidase-like protein
MSLLFLLPLLLLHSSSCLPAVTPIANDYNRSIFSGYLPINNTSPSNSSLFYIFYSAENVSNTSAPIVIWMNGGPGSSSMLGNFYENGPYQVKEENGKIVEKIREVNWGSKYNLLYVDQPVGTGLSFLGNISDLTTNQEQIADNFYNALQNFYKQEEFKDFIENGLIIAGESYAGKYVPSIAKKIVEWNQYLDNSSFPNPENYQTINLKGTFLIFMIIYPIYIFIIKSF